MRRSNNMAKIINMAEFQKRMRNELAAEILHHDQHPVQDTEADRLYATLNKLMAETPMADEEKIIVFWTKLVEQLAAIDNDSQRERYVKKMAKLLNQDIVGAARIAFAEF
jgi:hypothetical protein